MMLNADYELITKLRIVLTKQRYSPVVIGNYCAYARGFLDYLAQRNMQIAEATEAQVAQYLHHAIAMFRKRHGRSPGRYWHSIPRSGIHALLRLAQGQWPSAPKAICAADALRFAICDEYQTWLREERGLAAASIDALMWEGRNFLTWQLDRHGVDSLMTMTVADIDRYMDARSPHQARKSVKDVAERLRSMLRYLHRTGRTAIDLSPHAIAPLQRATRSKLAGETSGEQRSLAASSRCCASKSASRAICVRTFILLASIAMALARSSPYLSTENFLILFLPSSSVQ
jgi:hypothetical protein